MSVIQCSSDLPGNPNTFAVVQRFQVTDRFVEADALDVSQRGEDPAASRLTMFNKSGDTRVIECRMYVCFSSQLFRDHLAKIAATMNDIQPHELAGFGVSRLVD